MNKQYTFAIALSLMLSGAMAQSNISEIQPVKFSKVTITDSFWKPRINQVATVTLPVCIEQTEVKTPRIRNFEITAGLKEGKFEGIFYDDSDVYKALEAMAYSLKNKPDPEMEQKADEWISIIAKAQQPDGYLNTYYTLQFPEKRWTDMSMHEDYNGGHLIEAAVAYYDATGKKQLLDVATKFADHFASLFGPGKRHWVTGHQELELALVKLYKTTKDKKYLKMADWLLEERGHQLAKGYTWTDWKDTAYAQDVLPVKQQKQITGHAVRAMYMYTGAADVAALTGDKDYIHAMKDVWEDVVYRNMYITGGIGSSGRNEGFSKDYDLPNQQAYCETCASVGMVFWNQRMNTLTGDSKYADILERSLYNGALDGLSLSGDRFFYGNPLASVGNNQRSEWFGTACCPANISRLIASLGNYIYAQSDKGMWVNLYVGSETTFDIGDKEVPVVMKTNYPWEGKVDLSLNPKSATKFALHLRIPGWAQGQPVPGDLYRFINPEPTKFTVLLNGKEVPYKMDKGYAVIDRKWKKGDRVELNLPMEVKKIVAKDSLEYNNNRIALQRGPLVYCVEGVDNNDEAWNIVLPENTTFEAAYNKDLLNGVVTLKAEVPVVNVSDNKLAVSTSKSVITAIPYYSWANRGKTPMQVWLPTKITDVKLNY
ncbi:glycoside hydrolase family 127 protein [Pontibacter sp. 172403-2]|uniref:glycoside hydrolase family 127 protein n=1 Tax=Pontibacter rufus TaxID=2791028 RepID=UPI0018AF806D|nr:beta-L-arabinofuranosidase domain-containing protein [Pontibacter sp. 172403-2]MBF9254061.1 glycoside hydrolase family 127 protein [Pontibacter sp. 172403-2]